MRSVGEDRERLQRSSGTGSVEGGVGELVVNGENSLADDLERIGVVDVHCHRRALIFKICKVIHGLLI
ncbi:hypothetical protein NL676_022738 [Syzygium grande]|nr:hypothetical protein NL676_022738 [Syzygium grande]